MHKTTLEITKEKDVTPRGDCIVAVKADLSMPEFPMEFKGLLRSETLFKVTLSLPDYGLSDSLLARGCKNLPLSHPTEMVIRRSRFVCPRTLLISANKAARDLNRELVEMLKDEKTEVVITLQPLRDSEVLG